MVLSNKCCHIFLNHRFIKKHCGNYFTKTHFISNKMQFIEQWIIREWIRVFTVNISLWTININLWVVVTNSYLPFICIKHALMDYSSIVVMTLPVSSPSLSSSVTAFSNAVICKIPCTKWAYFQVITWVKQWSSLNVKLGLLKNQINNLKHVMMENALIKGIVFSSS